VVFARKAVSKRDVKKERERKPAEKRGLLRGGKK